MVKVTIELSKLEIEMLTHCIEGAIEVKHMTEKDERRAKDIIDKLSKYL